MKEPSLKWWRRPVAVILIYFFASRIILTIIGLIVLRYGNFSDAHSAIMPYTRFDWLNLWGHWDTGHYVLIADKWYRTLAAVSPTEFAFFPLYPTLMRGLGLIIDNFYVAGLIISNFALIGSGYLIYLIGKAEGNKRFALRVVKYFFLFPTAFLFSSVLTEGLFLLLTLVAYYMALKQRWVWAGIFGCFGAMTRSIGFILILPLAIIGLVNRKKDAMPRWNLLWLLLIPLGLVVVMLFNHYYTGDYLAFLHAQAAWNREFHGPIYWINLGLSRYMGYMNFTNTVVAVLVLAFSAYGFWRKKLNISELTIVLYVILVPLSSGLDSLTRYIVVAFPLYFLFARLTERRVSDYLISVCLIAAQIIFFIYWILGTYLVI